MSNLQPDTPRSANAEVDSSEQALAVAPRVDVLETENEFMILADVPGVRPENVDMRLKNLSRKEIDEAVEEALDAVGLSNKIAELPSDLSGGQRKRLGIARTLILKPEIILYDEPTSGLDPITCAEINSLILEVQQRYKTSAIVITHDLTCAKNTCDRLAMLIDGVFSKIGTFDEVVRTENEQIKKFYSYNFIQ